ncbi:hypothetical protein MPL3356_40434 [Mesorhizobium plurifarium]|uniref:Uncharacterized protein n=1 Tax=Mesorhizobium plurifarium TaxID=69974 RepID=A0A090FSU8_MESPL|nr:hypothetical protein MPL3356_40434 [Mesorhizobium plurifarium]CDX48756.1 hypothetical protein MPL3365_10017 [Mesorhizobium plurifarium]
MLAFPPLTDGGRPDAATGGRADGMPSFGGAHLPLTVSGAVAAVNVRHGHGAPRRPST